jgi:hypothetical protein
MIDTIEIVWDKLRHGDIAVYEVNADSKGYFLDGDQKIQSFENRNRLVIPTFEMHAYSRCDLRNFFLKYVKELYYKASDIDDCFLFCPIRHEYEVTFRDRSTFVLDVGITILNKNDYYFDAYDDVRSYVIDLPKVFNSEMLFNPDELTVWEILS